MRSRWIIVSELVMHGRPEHSRRFAAAAAGAALAPQCEIAMPSGCGAVAAGAR
jgi:hypothetical protein